MNLFYDTETTGLPDFKARSADPSQPHLVQLALVSCDEAGNSVDEISVIIRPNGWIIEPDMTAIHGISHERAMDEGIAEAFAVDMFIGAQARHAIRVAHNESFDRRIMRIAMTRAGVEREIIEAIEARPSFDTCRGSQALCNLPPTEKMLAKGMNGPKPPSLKECIQHFFSEELIGAHDALIDSVACARIYYHINPPVALPVPEVIAL